MTIAKTNDYTESNDLKIRRALKRFEDEIVQGRNDYWIVVGKPVKFGWFRFYKKVYVGSYDNRCVRAYGRENLELMTRIAWAIQEELGEKVEVILMSE